MIFSLEFGIETKTLKTLENLENIFDKIKKLLRIDISFLDAVSAADIV